MGGVVDVVGRRNQKMAVRDEETRIRRAPKFPSPWKVTLPKVEGGTGQWEGRDSWKEIESAIRRIRVIHS